MGEHTEISWTHSTFNPWWGCARVSPGCEHCYAETFAKRFNVQWGVKADRRLFGDKHWAEPLKWNAAAKASGKPHRVFCASMADVFEDRRDLDGQRDRLWSLIGATPNLDWLLLTKRPENFARMLPWMPCERGDICNASKVDGVVCPSDDEECDNENGVRGKPWKNVWLGVTVEDQRRADERIPLLLAAPATVRFLSVEPLLGAIDFTAFFGGQYATIDGAEPNYNFGIDWVIAGGESGPGARPMHPDWARSVRDQCVAAGVAFHYKQWGGLNKKLAGRVLDGRTWDELPTGEQK